ncbi:unnamed protein product [Hermetia illucens]|uniref:Ubiquitin-like protein ATG12 n=1 Tax=Hermetia illucens TaxID=343691 RepID=A0A7R8YS08_HERIL|nr:autophagy protein 12-like [Hermetia illucens]CAD7083268.1 unnamed protein product [Hermetia illucens]
MFTSHTVPVTSILIVSHGGSPFKSSHRSDKNKDFEVMSETESTSDKKPEVSNDDSVSTGNDKGSENQSTKVDILLNATGNVPIMKKRRWAVDQEKPISWIMKFVHKYLKLDPEEKLFLYVNQTFAPSPDQIVKNLYECHGTNGKLVLYYCKSQAWG